MDGVIFWYWKDKVEAGWRKESKKKSLHSEFKYSGISCHRERCKRRTWIPTHAGGG